MHLRLTRRNSLSSFLPFFNDSTTQKIVLWVYALLYRKLLKFLCCDKHLTHLPVVADPAHGTGQWEYVAPIAKAAVAAGADALMIEVHPDPSKAWSDGAQSLTFEHFGALMQELGSIASAVGRKL